jgi:two-component sensor histidine kinase
MAMVAASNEPLVLLKDDLTVVAASASFCRAFGIDPSSVDGKLLFALGLGEWDVPQLRSLLRATIAGHAEIAEYEMDLNRAGQAARRLVLHARKLDFADDGNVRLLLSITDVTTSRENERHKDALLREKAVLLMELQHRVANSLQIIASVLMQSARKAPTDQTRTHLFDAHSRVMSVAALQKQLAVSGLASVEVRPYLTELCHSISASMIPDRERLQLEVRSSDSSTGPETSVSLGLIVTELVINALKHGFPEGRGGKIVVSYDAKGDDWALSVRDDGVGMPADIQATRTGLGTNIVEALAKQLKAKVCLSDNNPGVLVSIVHSAATEASAPADHRL